MRRGGRQKRKKSAKSFGRWEYERAGQVYKVGGNKASCRYGKRAIDWLAGWGQRSAAAGQRRPDYRSRSLLLLLYRARYLWFCEVLVADRLSTQQQQQQQQQKQGTTTQLSYSQTRRVLGERQASRQAGRVVGIRNHRNRPVYTSANGDGVRAAAAAAAAASERIGSAAGIPSGAAVQYTSSST